MHSTPACLLRCQLISCKCNIHKHAARFSREIKPHVDAAWTEASIKTEADGTKAEGDGGGWCEGGWSYAAASWVDVLFQREGWKMPPPPPQWGWVHFVSAFSFPLHPVTHFSRAAHIKTSCQKRRLKMQKQPSLLQAPAHFASFGRGGGDKAQDLPDTSNQWNPEGLPWVFNEVHCS